MKRHLLKLLRVSPALLAVSLCQAQTQPPANDDYLQPVPLEHKRPQTRNRISLSYRMGLNITADFKKLGGFAGMTGYGPATGSAVNREYDNGYNRVDSSGNAGGLTWYWGYSDPNSIQGNTLVLSRSSSLPNGVPADGVSKDNSGGPQHGFEIAYGRELFRDARGWRYGLEGAFGYTLISINDSGTPLALPAAIARVSDVFDLAGVVPPPAGYEGTFAGPGPVIGSEPLLRTWSIVSGTATVAGERSLDANVFSLRLGPYAQIPVYDRFSVLLSGGLYLAAGQTRFSFNETVTIPGVGSQTHSGSGWQTDFLVGGYVGGNIEYALTEEVGLFVGAQFQSAGRAVHDEKGKQAVLNLDQSVVVSFGVSYSF